MLSGKVVVISGGAGLVGSELCRAVARAGAAVFIADIEGSKANDLAYAINAEVRADRCVGLSLDITDVASIRSAIARVQDRQGKIDALVNSAYPRNRKYGNKLEDVTYESFCGNVSMHLGGYFLTSKEFALHFKSHGGGNIINLCSIYGSVAPRFQIYKGTTMTMPVEYAAIKSGILHLTRYMAKYFQGFNIRLNCLSPGGIRDQQDPLFLARYAEYSMSKGMLDAKDLGGTLVFLLSDGSQFINGQNIVVDDGWSM